jgi:AcrR family transcriptional regulator
MTDRGRRSRDRIVEAASALMQSCGVAGAGIDRILAAAEASKSQLYHYFEDKDDLIRAVIADRFEQIVDGQLPLLASLDSWASIRRWLDLLVTVNESAGYPGCGIGTMAGELAERDEELRHDLARCFTIWQQYLVDGLERMHARGQLVQSADPERLAVATFASLQGGLLLSKTQKETEPLRIALDAAFAYLRTFRAERSRS